MYKTLILLTVLYCVHSINACDGSFPNFCGTSQLEVGPPSLFGPCNNGNGNAIPKEQASSQPTIKFSNAAPNKKYMLVMRDPDAGNAKDVLHWLLTDIMGVDLRTGDINKYTIESYWGPNPPSGSHRYQFLLFEQSSPVDLSTVKRIRFNTNKFLEANGLCPTDAIATFQFKSY